MATLDGVFTALTTLINANYDYQKSEPTPIERDIARRVFSKLKSELQTSNGLALDGAVPTSATATVASVADHHQRTTALDRSASSFLFQSSGNLRPTTSSATMDRAADGDTSIRSRLGGETLNAGKPQPHAAGSALSRHLARPSAASNSFFYSGKTTFGGAAARRTTRLASSNPYSLSQRTPAAVRMQVNNKQQSQLKDGLSSTAKSILASLEKSSPIDEAKRITIADHVPSSSKSLELSRLSAPFRPKVLQPSLTSISSSTSRHPRSLQWNLLQQDLASSDTSDSSSRRRPAAAVATAPTASTSTTEPDAESGATAAKQQKPTEPLVTKPPPVSTTAAASITTGSSTVLNSKRLAARAERGVQQPRDELDKDTYNPGDLPTNVRLQIAPDKLPSFNYLPPISQSVPASSLPSLTTAKVIEKPATINNNDDEFKFSAPLVAVPVANKTVENSVASKDKMEDPRSKEPSPSKLVNSIHNSRQNSPAKPSTFELEKSPSPAPAVTKPTADITTTVPENSPKDNAAPPPSNQIPLSELFKKKDGEWECKACGVRNKPDADKCVACETARLTPATPSTPAKSLAEHQAPKLPSSSFTFGLSASQPSVPKPAPSLIFGQNSSMSTSFGKPAVEQSQSASFSFGSAGVKAAFPSLGQQPLPAMSTSFTATTAPAIGSPVFSFTAPSNASAGLEKTPAPTSAITTATSTTVPEVASQETKGPSNQIPLSEMFKKKDGQWDCKECCVPNKPEADKCVACETPRVPAPAKETVGVSAMKPAPSPFVFGLPASQPSAPKPSTFSFGQSSSTPMSTAFGKPVTEQPKPLNFSFGGNTEPAKAAFPSLGQQPLSSATNQLATTAPSTFNFAGAAAPAAAQPLFSFNATSSNASVGLEKASVPAAAPSTTITAPSVSLTTPAQGPTEMQASKPAPSFIFGQNASQPSAPKPAFSTFAFGQSSSMPPAFGQPVAAEQPQTMNFSFTGNTGAKAAFPSLGQQPLSSATNQLPTMPPAFNFSGATAPATGQPVFSFTATPSDANDIGPGGRKIKKAKRRLGGPL